MTEPDSNIEVGQLYKWGEMHENEFGNRKFEKWYFRVIAVNQDSIIVNIAHNIIEPTKSRNLSRFEIGTEIRAGRMCLLSDNTSQIIQKVSRLEKIDD